MTTEDVDTITPQTIINIRPVVAALKEFFGSSQLSGGVHGSDELAGRADRSLNGFATRTRPGAALPHESLSATSRPKRLLEPGSSRASEAPLHVLDVGLDHGRLRLASRLGEPRLLALRLLASFLQFGARPRWAWVAV